ncbi:glycosyltransferase [Actinoplanes friuliensis]|uniref:Glycosyl transferase family protein n=1 Tax=Actinoplanes friuliensis DSM 7358 TaxID=1246995 RepID=U5W3Q7_9ACTN|nr:glycosyltransferase [Actinoplanes friuliensis]AGZ43652.1 glycosyl transferase family protein [Actinoplanes friuliensis DSM 7358]
MRVLIVTSGSTGDVAPYTGLGARLREAGHEVTLATHEPFRDTVELPFVPLPGDLREILPQARGQDGSGSGTGPRALLRLMRIARPLVAELGDGIVRAVEQTRPDAMLLSTVVAPLGYQVAEAAGIPWAGVFLQPVFPTGDFGPVLIGGRPLGRLGNRLTGRFLESAAHPLYARPVRDLRRRLGLPQRGMAALQRAQQHRWPTFHGFSPTVVPRPADWPASQEVVGYWWPERPSGWTPPREVEAFLAAGPAPVFIGFGSMAAGRGERLAAPVLEAVTKAGVRAIVQAGWSGLTVAGGPDVLSVGPMPHDWLFPRMAAVVHHSGAGTTAAGLRAGVPAVPVPVLADQPFWARRLRELGVAPAGVPLPRLTADRLAGALRAATTDPRHAARAQEVAAALRTEDGAARIIAWLKTQQPSS